MHFLYEWNSNCWLYMMLTLYNVDFIDEHYIGLNFYVWWWLHMIWCYMKYFHRLRSLLVYLIMWGYGASHEHCICRIGLGLWVRVLCVLMIWTLEHEMLICLYEMVFLYLNVNLSWCNGDHCLVYDLVCASRI